MVLLSTLGYGQKFQGFDSLKIGSSTINNQKITEWNNVNLKQNKFVINVKDYGAVGNGVVNDIAAIRSAILVIKNNGGGKLYLPRGVYFVTDSIVIDFSNVTIEGDGIGATIIKVGAWVDGIRVSKGYPLPKEILQNIVIQNLTIDGNKDGYANGPNDTYGNGINVNGCNNVIIQNCEVKNPAEQGIVSTYWNISDKAKSIVIDKCIVHGCKINRIGIGIEGQSRNSRVTNNSVFDGGFIFVGNGASGNIDDGECIISNNTVEEGKMASGVGVWINGSLNNIIINSNTVRGFGIGIRTSSEKASTKGFIVSNNILLNYRNYGIITLPTLNNEPDESVISNNQLSTNSTTSKAIHTFKKTIITGNNIRGSAARGIEVNDSCLIIGNLINALGSISVYLTGALNVVVANYLSTDIYCIKATSNEFFANYGTGTLNRGSGFYLNTNRFSAANGKPPDSEGKNGDHKLETNPAVGFPAGWIKAGGVWQPYGIIGGIRASSPLRLNAGVISADTSDASSGLVTKGFLLKSISTPLSGQLTTLGNGSSGSFKFSHGQKGVSATSQVFVTARTVPSVVKYVEINSTFITIYTTLIPDNNAVLKWDWQIVK